MSGASHCTSAHEPQAASKEAALTIMRESVKRSEATGASNAESLAALSEQALLVLLLRRQRLCSG